MQLTKTMLITGAGKRVGRIIALSLADHGWDVAIHYRHAQAEAGELAALIHEKGRKAYLAQADLSDPKQVARVIPSLSEQGVMLDGLVNNAAAFEKDTLATLTPESWQLHMDANLFAPLQLMRDFAAQYKGGSGVIINITDGMKGWSMSTAFLSYAVSKNGLAFATELLARELAPAIRINAIAPGPVLEGKQDKEDTFAKLRDIIPLGRTGAPEEIRDAILYILSAPMMTGQTIMLSGGMTAP